MSNLGIKNTLKNAKQMQCRKDKLDKQISKHQVESIVLSHATVLVDGANKSTTVAKDLKADSIGDRHALCANVCAREYCSQTNKQTKITHL